MIFNQGPELNWGLGIGIASDIGISSIIGMVLTSDICCGSTVDSGIGFATTGESSFLRPLILL